MWAQIINIVLGLAVTIAPAVLGFEKQAANNNYIAGPLIITFSLVACAEATRNVRWFNIPAGVWLITSGFIFSGETTAILFNTVTGILIIIFSLFKGRIKNRFGGGWRSLLQQNPEHMREAGQQQASSGEIVSDSE